MSELTGLELCRAIAEVENHKLATTEEIKRKSLHIDSVYTVTNEERLTAGTICRVYSRFNPLTDKALLFDLMVKHEVQINYPTNDVYIVDENSGEYDSGCSAFTSFNDADELPRAILTAIIEANK